MSPLTLLSENYKRKSAKIEMISNDKELIQLIASGFSSKEIACLMRHTESTIDSYRNRLLKRVGVRNAPQLVAWAFRNRILTIKK